jgi:hypothetical protein
MKLVAAGTVCCGKGLVETEPASFIGLFFMTRKTEGVLRGDQEFLVRRLMGLVAGVATLSRRRLMAATVFLVGCRFMTGQAEGLLIVFELKLTGRTMAVMT